MNPRVLIGGALFGIAAALGLFLAALIISRVQGHDDGPRPKRVPSVLLVVAAIMFGGVYVVRADSEHLAIAVLLCLALITMTACDLARGIIPDPLSVGAFVLVAGDALVLHHDPRALVSGFLLFVPFAIVAAISRGRGIGWGDARLAAVLGAVLGLMNGLLAAALAAFAATVSQKFDDAVAPIAGDGTVAAPVPIAFGPYMIGTMMVFAIWTAA